MADSIDKNSVMYSRNSNILKNNDSTKQNQDL